jgi:polyhydroxyalkanoate synthase subunit PhaC
MSADTGVVPSDEAVVPSLGEAVAGLAAVLGQGRAVARGAATLGGELLRVAAGRSEVAPEKGDKRFDDPAWTHNPLFDRLGRGYLAVARTVHDLVEELAANGDHRRAEQARFATTILTSALAPTNVLATNPAALKRAFETGGHSLARGLRHLVDDLVNNGGMPSMVDREPFGVGSELAVTPGAVIDRDAVAEVLQYRPTTREVHERPVLVVPPPIGRYYFLDLRPGRSFVEYAVGQGLQTFVLSWRNPGEDQGHWDLDTYAGRVSAAIDTVREVTGSDDVNLVGFCAGGIISTTLLGHLADVGDPRVHSMSYAVTLLDFDEQAPITAFDSTALVRVARARSRHQGVITGEQLGAAFAWMRPDDLVFNYVVNNYLMGEKPPAIDVLAWNADSSNLPAALHAQFLDLFHHNLLVEPGAVTVLGSPVHLKDISVPIFVTGAVTDHLTPWVGCYRTTQLLSGEATFVLSYSGHIASLVNPPDNPKAHYWVDGPLGPDPQAWLDGASRREGSWWEAWAGWIGPHAGDRVPAPAALGSAEHPELEPAPGSYVLDA